MKNWKTVPLGQLLKPVNRPEEVEVTKKYQLLGAHWYAKGLYVKEVKNGSEIRASKLYRVTEGDFAYNRLFAWKGSFAVASKENDGCYVSNEFPCFHIDKQKLHPDFIRYYFSRESAWNEALGLSSGGTPTSRNRLKVEKLFGMNIPLPPLSEQRRIVAKIDQLAQRIDEARILRTRSATELACICNRASAQIFGAIDCKTFPLGELLREKSRNGLSARPSDSPPGIPILRISAGTSRSDGMVDEHDHKFLNVAEESVSSYFLQPGDLLACRFNGNLHYVGKFSQFLGETKQPRLYPDKLIRFRVDESRVLAEYIREAMNSPLGRERIEAFCATTAGNIGISAKNLNSIPIPVPTIEKQHRIVNHLAKIRNAVGTGITAQSNTSAELDALLPSILDRAFKGEL